MTTATLAIDLFDEGDSVVEQFIEVFEGTSDFPILSHETRGRNTVLTVDADSDPDEYSVLMAATSAMSRIAVRRGLVGDELEEYLESLGMDATILREEDFEDDFDEEDNYFEVDDEF